MPSENTPEELIRSFRVVTIKLTSEDVVIVDRVASCITFCILNISKIDTNLFEFGC